MSESWCCVVGGSDQQHEIAADGCTLIDEGFLRCEEALGGSAFELRLLPDA
ncbi:MULTISPECIES: hypothetical protein [Burkholderia]|uniref:hypothetical protein n=1 Tax=Burkholderia TaxID=32008 RepID=UPI00158178BF|nr:MULTISPECIES: hypothetical protein [Burkholderia]